VRKTLHYFSAERLTHIEIANQKRSYAWVDKTGNFLGLFGLPDCETCVAKNALKQISEVLIGLNEEDGSLQLIHT
jgi:hypothetical protein